ncbi:DUF3618 domain-containing protein [Corynebacterium pseudodiphtheriticum]|uniref:DUF3618 domain-containing protein n=1 Tax=Corynebacterium pseudodiphtheriticum TaxID=37637 RepID=A0AAP4BNR7_9CORY|nr:MULTISPECIES: DUF3618 domain-containing protein [Corynebacterium]ERJ42109.1 membrane protein [Corynebacterium pseudodiphtheriticum 090104]ERS42093.1 hypothetical protein HMPREF1292_00159 [Corynebacterium sp. KPL1995]ERS75101.1 hypothetical protein HMPREF1290_00160 [Corynebacterium sp. KPL1989]MCG7252938.1 DUF3618 domain-containing protein [Corynebacterium pseudodiphtheriticum]MCT1636042.1 DUF3618 domain-containing protein [Corynebacterium pseudodiphtheriticum]
MARKIDDIQRDIERTRKQLAGTLDELAQRTKPGNLVNDAKSNLLEKLQDPQVQKILAGVGAVVAAGIAFNVFKGRQRKNDIQELKRMIVEHDV